MPLTPENRDYCREALPAVSRTFALGIELLREPLRDEIGVAYLICRILDTIEDTTELPAKERAALLDRCATELVLEHKWQDCCRDIEAMFSAAWTALSGDGLHGPDHELCRNATTVLTTFHEFRAGAREAQRVSIREMAEGMAETVRREERGEGLRLDDEEDLKRYCYYVAGTVGKLLCNEWALDRESITPEIKAELDKRAINFGLGLQVTNIIKGVTDDIQRGVAYVPHKLFAAAGIDLQTLIDDPTDPRGREVVAGLADMTLLWLDEALEYTVTIPRSERDIRLFCALPLVFAVRTLARALKTTEVFSESVLKITREEVKQIHAEVEAAIADDTALRNIHQRERTEVVAQIEAARAAAQ
ncbi:MAG: squalene/phytoene synthase family protein [Planctomycetes bacterium]|nr:squalene/phytoene synthase family protein [Planctomycetota bacterium]